MIKKICIFSALLIVIGTAIYLLLPVSVGSELLTPSGDKAKKWYSRDPLDTSFEYTVLSSDIIVVAQCLEQSADTGIFSVITSIKGDYSAEKLSVSVPKSPDADVNFNFTVSDKYILFLRATGRLTSDDTLYYPKQVDMIFNVSGVRAAGVTSLGSNTISKISKSSAGLLENISAMPDVHTTFINRGFLQVCLTLTPIWLSLTKRQSNRLHHI